MESMIIYQKRLVLNLFIKKISQDQGLYIILGPRQFEHKMNVRNTKRWISGMKKVHVRNTFRIMDRHGMWIIIFLTHANFSTHAKILWSHTTHETLAKVWSCHPRTHALKPPTLPNPLIPLTHLIPTWSNYLVIYW